MYFQYEELEFEKHVRFYFRFFRWNVLNFFCVSMNIRWRNISFQKEKKLDQLVNQFPIVKIEFSGNTSY